MSSDDDNPRLSPVAELARTLGNTHRLALLDLVAQAERTVDRLAELSGLSVANTSQHLQQLKRSGLVFARRDGKSVFYRLGDGPVMEVLSALGELADHQRSRIRALVSDSVTDPNSLDALSRADLLSRLHDDSVILLDVRPIEDYVAGHLPGALSIPLAELERRLSELPAGREIVAYCRGPYCVLSVQAAALLRSHGRTVRRLRDGFGGWKAAGLTVEQEF